MAIALAQLVYAASGAVLVGLGMGLNWSTVIGLFCITMALAPIIRS